MESIVNLRKFRQVLNLSQAKAAESIGIDQRQWSRYENGLNELPLRYFIALIKAHRISADWLLSL